MHRFYERWCASRPGTRVLCWGTVTLAATLVAWQLMVKPLRVLQADLAARTSEAARVSATLWSAIRRFPPSVVQASPPLRPFSVLDFQFHGVTLIHWKPLPTGGELTLDAGWEQIPSIFTRLAQLDVRINGFDIRPQGGQLRVSIRLELDHAQ